MKTFKLITESPSVSGSVARKILNMYQGAVVGVPEVSFSTLGGYYKVSAKVSEGGAKELLKYLKQDLGECAFEVSL